MPPHLEFSSTEVEVDSANKFFFTELAFGKEREDTTALVCAESAEANGATHANMAPVAIIATDVLKSRFAKLCFIKNTDAEIIVLTLIINAIH